jgi:hypothetical protein
MRSVGRCSWLAAWFTAAGLWAQAPILDTPRQNPPFSPASPAWARDVCHGERYFVSDYPPYGWMPVSDEVVGASGVAVMPALAQHDVPFTHPFGLDWEFFLAPDARYQGLLAPANRGPDSDYVAANRRAAALGLATPRGVLGVEIDRGLVPRAYRARQGDRIAIFGNWIVDCGHTDFHTEIHPPLLLACARRAGQATVVSVVARPWLVTERFSADDEPIRRHLVNEVLKLETLRSLRVEAHPEIRPPFAGVQRLRFTLRPPLPRRSKRDRLMVSFHFTVRHGVTVQLSDAGADAVGVLVSMNAAEYSMAPLPHRSDWDVPVGKLRTRTPVIDRIQLANAFANPLAAVLLSRDWVTDHYDAAVAASPHDSEITTRAVTDLGGGTPVAVDDAQPFPVYGHLRVTWERHR